MVITLAFSTAHTLWTTKLEIGRMQLLDTLYPTSIGEIFLCLRTQWYGVINIILEAR